MRKVISAADKVLDTCETYLMVGVMVLFAFGVVIDVICRKFFGVNLPFMQELGKYLMVWATFIGASLGVKCGEHPSMTLVIDTVSTAPKIVMSVLVNLISAAATGFAGYWSLQQFLLLKKMGTVTTTLWSLPVYVLYCIVPLELMIMALRFAAQAVKRPMDILEAREGGEQT